MAVRRGRKELPKEQVLSRVIHMRMPTGAASEIEQAAEAIGIKPSQAYRACVNAVLYNDQQAKALGRMVRDALVENDRQHEDEETL